MTFPATTLSLVFWELRANALPHPPSMPYKRLRSDLNQGATLSIFLTTALLRVTGTHDTQSVTKAHPCFLLGWQRVSQALRESAEGPYYLGPALLYFELAC